MRCSVCLAAISLSLVPSVSHAATILFSNGAPAQSGGTVISSPVRAAAQPFTLGYAANLTSIVFANWMDDLTGNGLNAGSLPIQLDWRITTTGIGGTTLFSGSGASLSVLPGTTVSFGPNNSITEQEVQFSLGNIWFQAGTYYLELLNETVQNQVALGLEGRWGGSTTNSADAQNFNNGSLTFNNPTHFFEVIGVPEPAALALFGLGLGAMGLLRRRA